MTFVVLMSLVIFHFKNREERGNIPVSSFLNVFYFQCEYIVAVVTSQGKYDILVFLTATHLCANQYKKRDLSKICR